MFDIKVTFDNIPSIGIVYQTVVEDEISIDNPIVINESLIQYILNSFVLIF
jgi:hypothetical protein